MSALKTLPFLFLGMTDRQGSWKTNGVLYTMCQSEKAAHKSNRGGEDTEEDQLLSVNNPRQQ